MARKMTKRHKIVREKICQSGNLPGDDVCKQIVHWCAKWQRNAVKDKREYCYVHESSKSADKDIGEEALEPARSTTCQLINTIEQDIDKRPVSRLVTWQMVRRKDIFREGH